MMILHKFLKIKIISLQQNWNLAGISFIRNFMIDLIHLSLDILLVQRNTKTLTIESILEGHVPLTSSLLNCACTVKNWSMMILDTPIDANLSMLLQARRKQAVMWRTLLKKWRWWQWPWRILLWSTCYHKMFILQNFFITGHLTHSKRDNLKQGFSFMKRVSLIQHSNNI